MLERVNYGELNARQKENYNFHKVAAVLADYEFNCIRLSDDWQGADFLACHISGEPTVRIQLKGRLALNKKYVGKQLFVAFRYNDHCYVYPHDELLQQAKDQGALHDDRDHWRVKGSRTWRKPPSWALSYLEQHRYT